MNLTPRFYEHPDESVYIYTSFYVSWILCLHLWFILIVIAPSLNRVLQGLHCVLTICNKQKQNHSKHEVDMWSRNVLVSTPWVMLLLSALTLKAPVTTAADDKFCDTFPNFRKKIRYSITWESSASRRFSWNIMPYLLFLKIQLNLQSSLLQIIGGALRVNTQCWVDRLQLEGQRELLDTISEHSETNSINKLDSYAHEFVARRMIG